MKYTALILILSVFVVMGCSSGDDQDKGAEVFGPTGPTVSKGPQKIYISAGKDELDSEKLPDYLKTDLGEPAEVTVETAGSKWKIVVGEKIYEAQYHDFASDAGYWRDDRRKFFGQGFFGDRKPLGYEISRGVNVRAPIEFDPDNRKPDGASAAHTPYAWQAVYGTFDGEGHILFDFVGSITGRFGQDDDRRRIKFRENVHRHARYLKHGETEDEHCDHDHEDRVFK